MIRSFMVTSLCFLLLACKTTSADKIGVSTFELEDLAIKQELDFFEIDGFENLYLIKDHKLFLYNNSQELQYTYENSRLGNITSLDVSNPQKILVFFNDYDIIVTLDNTLNEVAQVDLKLYDYNDIDVVALSNDNQIWLYDPVTFLLRKISVTGEVAAESLPLYSQYLEPHNTTKILESGNRIYFADEKIGLMQFDNLGQFIKLIPLKELRDFQIINNSVIYCNADGAFSYEIAAFGQFAIEGLNEKNREQWKQVRLTNTYAYYGFDQGIRISQR